MYDKTWTMDYKPVEKKPTSLLNSDKIWAIKHMLKDDFSIHGTEAFGYKRNNYEFTSYQKGQSLLAENTLREVCPKCFDESFDKINNIKNSSMSFIDSFKLDDPKIKSVMAYESQRAQKIVEEMFSKRYSGLYYD